MLELNHMEETKRLITLSRLNKGRHAPSGIIITWLGGDNKVHTKSIANRHTSIGLKQVEIDAKTELLLCQLNCLSWNNEARPMPMISTGLTRKEAKQAFVEKLQIETTA